MQERVHLTPPETKAFEGKAPPTSWFNENVVRFMQIQSEQEFLRDLLSFVKELQADKLAKTISAPVAREAEFAKIPKGADAEDVTHAYLYNALMPALKTEIEFLERLIVIVQKGNPQLTKELDEFLTELKTMAKGFPNLQPAQITFLNLITKNLKNYVGRLPIGFQRKYYDQEFNMLFKMMQVLDEFLKDGGNEFEDIEGKLKLIGNLGQGAKSLEETMVSVRQNKQFSPEDLNQILAFLQALAEGSSQLSPAAKKRIEGLLKSLGAIKGMNGQKLPQVLSDAVLQKWIQEFLKSNPGGSVSQLKEYLLNFFDESNLKKTSLPFLGDLGDFIKALLKNKSFPFMEGNSGNLLAVEKEDKITPNPNLAQNISQGFVVDGRSTSAVSEARKSLSETLKTEHTELQNHKEGLKSSLEQGRNMRDSLGSSAVPAAANSMGSGSVPDDFKKAILDHFLPYQEEYMLQLSFILNYNNFGAEMGNQLLDHVMDFQDAQTNYGLFNSLHADASGTKNQFIGSQSQVQAQLDAERAAARRDLRKIDETFAYINHKISTINDDPSLSRHEKSILIGHLMRYSGNLNAAKDQLSNLSRMLHYLHVGPAHTNGTKYPNSCTVYFSTDSAHNYPYNGDTGWQSSLATNEGDVINGYSGTRKIGEDVGGLVNIQNMIQTDQEDYSDQSQTMQMRLQMHLTETQQEVSLTTTAMSLINQMYMTCAQAIYK